LTFVHYSIMFTISVQAKIVYKLNHEKKRTRNIKQGFTSV